MSGDPTYTIWHPSLGQDLENQSFIEINITPAAYHLMPTGPLEFFELLLRDIGTSARPKSWKTLTYRSNYHGEQSESASWREKWPINWRVVITLSDPVSEFVLDEHEYFESYAFSSNPVYYPDNSKEKVGCLMISDFNNSANLKKARSMIEASESVYQMVQALEISHMPEFYSVNIGNEFFQLQVYLGEFSDSFFEDGADYAHIIEGICQNSNGITSFDRRAIEWDEL